MVWAFSSRCFTLFNVYYVVRIYGLQSEFSFTYCVIEFSVFMQGKVLAAAFNNNT